MSWFKCSIEGENFPGQLIGEASPVGFYTTRYVEANSVQDAESIALNHLKNEPSLVVPESVEKPMNAKVHFKNIEQVNIDAVQSNLGFIFFVMGT